MNTSTEGEWTAQDQARLDAITAASPSQRKYALAYLTGRAPEAFDEAMEHAQTTSLPEA